MRIIKVISIVLISIFILNGCFSISYSTKGGSIPPELKTVSVQYFDNRAERVEPSLSQKLTDELKKYMEGNTKLRMVNTVGEADFSGEITEYSVTPTAFAANDAAMTRFTIRVRVKYTNTLKPDTDFDSSFSEFRDFKGSTDFTGVETELSNEMIKEIIEQIYNKAFVNW